MIVENVKVQIRYPDGYEFSRYGIPRTGDHVLLNSHKVCHFIGHDSDIDTNFFILRKLT